jgi:hypothetical protein
VLRKTMRYTSRPMVLNRVCSQNKPKDLSAFVSEERGHGEGGDGYGMIPSCQIHHPDIKIVRVYSF